jgi:hypothetical protein
LDLTLPAFDILGAQQSALEPASLTMFGAALLALVVFRRRQRK